MQFQRFSTIGSVGAEEQADDGQWRLRGDMDRNGLQFDPDTGDAVEPTSTNVFDSSDTTPLYSSSQQQQHQQHRLSKASTVSQSKVSVAEDSEVRRPCLPESVLSRVFTFVPPLPSRTRHCTPATHHHARDVCRRITLHRKRL